MESGALGSNTRSVSYQLCDLEQVFEPLSSSAGLHHLATTYCIFRNVGHISKQNRARTSVLRDLHSCGRRQAINAKHKKHMYNSVIRVFQVTSATGREKEGRRSEFRVPGVEGQSKCEISGGEA